MTNPLRFFFAPTFPSRNRRANLGAALVVCSATALVGTGSSQSLLVLNLVLLAVLLLGAVLFACSPMRD